MTTLQQQARALGEPTRHTIFRYVCDIHLGPAHGAADSIPGLVIDELIRNDPRQEPGIADRREIDKGDVNVPKPTSRLQRQRRLADPARPDHRHKPATVDQPLQLFDFLCPADEARCPARQRAVEVAFHDRTEPCGGNSGRFRGDHRRRRVDVCVPDRGTFASDLQRQRTLVHELAHASDHANLDRRDRTELLRIVDATDWYAPELGWEERGVERFAETIVWGLYDQLRRPTLIGLPCRELYADFLAITGFTARGPLERVCRPLSHHLHHHPAHIR